MKKAAVVGNPVDHSLSPDIHSFWLNEAGINGIYTKETVKHENFGDFIVNAAKKAKQLNLRVVTFSGFNEDNPLRQIGDLNFWLPSKAYNIIENTHSIWITTVVDMILGKAEYNVN